jgi:hypothetical protein
MAGMPARLAPTVILVEYCQSARESPRTLCAESRVGVVGLAARQAVRLSGQGRVQNRAIETHAQSFLVIVRRSAAALTYMPIRYAA